MKCTGIENLRFGGVWTAKLQAMAKDVFLSDVAEAAGVSVAAASRALNNRDGVRDEVRERVKETARTLGYRPNRSAKRLAGGETGVVAFIMDVQQLRYGPWASELLRALSAAANAHDQGLLFIGETLGDPSESVQNLLRDGIVDGVIVSAIDFGEAWVAQRVAAGLPTVLVGEHPRGAGVPVVEVENFTSSRLLVSRLIGSGCTRIATVTGLLDRVDAQRRLAGYRAALADAGLVFDESLIFSGAFHRSSGEAAAQGVLDAGADAVFCANDEIAVGLYTSLRNVGVSVPGQVSIAGFDATARHQPGSPNLTSLAQPFNLIATKAFQTIGALLAGDPVPLEQLIAPTIHWGETTRRLPDGRP